MYMDDIKLFAKKNEKEQETLINTVGIYSQDIRMEFGIEKCAMLVMRSSKPNLMDGTELPNQDKIRRLGGILEADTIKQVEMKWKFQKDISGELESYSRQNCKQKPYQRNKYLGCNLRYSVSERNFYKWTKK